MKKEKKEEKKLSLEKIQMMKIKSSTNAIKGGSDNPDTNTIVNRTTKNTNTGN